MNLFDAGNPAPEEITRVLFEDAHTRIERITSWGQRSAADFWYDQDEDEWVSVLAGRATLRLMDANDSTRDVHLAPGDTLLLPAHMRHQITHTDAPTIWLCVFSKG